MRQKAFEGKGRFFKGNLHTHTSISDGKRPVGEVIGIYKDKGYDFLAITDHNTVFRSEEFNNGIYIMPGLEIHCHSPEKFRTHHMVALTTYDNDATFHGERIENVEWTDSAASAAEMHDLMTGRGFLPIYCHSMWSRTEPSEYDRLDLRAMEVYNGVCEYVYDQGNQEVYWDTLLRMGKRIWGVATDDCHGADQHYGRGYVMARMDGLNDRNIMKALSEGSFYSSRGPEIHDFYIEDGEAHVVCSPVQQITFITYEYLGKCYRDEGWMTEKSFRFHEGIDYIRVEVTDEQGMKAWTNPIFLT
ncbi:MAG: CehA/McbA family metallohydrolase [Clostridia bacterium]